MSYDEASRLLPVAVHNVYGCQNECGHSFLIMQASAKDPIG